MTEQLHKLVIGTFTVLGCLCIISGISIPHMIKFEKDSVVKLNVTQKQVTNVKNNEIKLKDIQLEIGKSLSTDCHDYLVDPNNIEESIIKQLKLNISKVNINEEGNYTYSITYNKKIYNGSITITPKPLPNVDSITLNALSLEVGSTLPTNIETYVQEKLAPEVLAAIKLDISNVNPTIPGRYLYSISYNKMLYTSTITIYEPQLTKDIQSIQKES